MSYKKKLMKYFGQCEMDTLKSYEPVIIRLLRPKSKKAAMQLNDWPQDYIDKAYLKDLEAYVEELEGRESDLYSEIKRLRADHLFKVRVLWLVISIALLVCLIFL